MYSNSINQEESIFYLLYQGKHTQTGYRGLAVSLEDERCCLVRRHRHSLHVSRSNAREQTCTRYNWPLLLHSTHNTQSKFVLELALQQYLHVFVITDHKLLHVDVFNIFVHGLSTEQVDAHNSPAIGSCYRHSCIIQDGPTATGKLEYTSSFSI